MVKVGVVPFGDEVWGLRWIEKSGTPTPEKRALHPSRKWMGKITHQFQLRATVQGAHQVGCEAAALWLEHLHGLRREIALDDAAVWAAFGGDPCRWEPRDFSKPRC